jgi:uncharacterized protein
MALTDWMLALCGGALIGASASMMLLLNGRIAGISGIVGGLLRPTSGDVAWRVWFLVGLVGGGAVLFGWKPELFESTTVPPGLVVAAGLCVGFGTRLGSGCTSGHGVCGISRLSLRSVIATLTFIAAGVASTYLTRHVFHWGAGL